MQPGNLLGRNKRKQQAHAERRKQNPDSSTDSKQQYGLHEQLADQHSATGTQRDTQGDLFPASLQMNAAQVADVDAEQQQRKPQGSGQRDHRGAEISGNRFAEGNHQRSVVFVFGIKARKPLSDHVHRRLRRFRRDSRAKLGGNAITALRTFGGCGRRLRKHGPDVNLIFWWERESGWSNADDGMSSTVQRNFLAGEIGIRTIFAFPEIVAEDYSAVAARAVLRSEKSAGRGNNSGRRKDFRRNYSGAYAFRVADVRARSGITPRQPHDDIGGNRSAVPLPIAKSWNGNTDLLQRLRIRATFPEIDPLVRVDRAVRFQKYSVNH